MLKSHIQLPADADRDQLSEVFQQALAVPHQQDAGMGLGLSSALWRSQLVCGYRELTKHFGTNAGDSHSSGEHRVSVVRSGCSNCQTKVCRKCSSFGACSCPLSYTQVLDWVELWPMDGVAGAGPRVQAGCVSAGMCVSSQVRGVRVYLAHSSCVNLGVHT